MVVKILRSLSDNDGDGYEKVKSRCFKLYCPYSILFSLSNFGNFFWSWILKDCIKVQEKKNKVVVLCLRSTQNVKLLRFSRRCRAVTVKKFIKSLMHLQSCYFANLNILLFLPFSLMSPSPLLKAPYDTIQRDPLGVLASWSSLMQGSLTWPFFVRLREDLGDTII